MPSASKLAGTKNTVSKSSLVDIQDAIALASSPAADHCRRTLSFWQEHLFYVVRQGSCPVCHTKSEARPGGGEREMSPEALVAQEAPGEPLRQRLAYHNGIAKRHSSLW